MNTLCDEKFFECMRLFWDGASVREVSRKVGIHRDTANRIQRLCTEEKCYYEGHYFRHVGGRPRDGRKRLRCVFQPWTKPDVSIPQLTWVDVDDADQTVILFEVKTRYVYAYAMCFLEDRLVCNMGNLWLDYFRNAAHERDGRWQMQWLSPSLEGWENEMCYPVPWMPGVRFANQLRFVEAFGWYREEKTVEAWNDIVYEATKLAYRNDGELQMSWGNSFAWQANEKNCALFQALWNASAQRGYTLDDSLNEGRGPLWKKVYKMQEEKKRQEAWWRHQEQLQLRRKRRKKIKVNPMEMMAYGNIIAKK